MISGGIDLLGQFSDRPDRPDHRQLMEVLDGRDSSPGGQLVLCSIGIGWSFGSLIRAFQGFLITRYQMAGLHVSTLGAMSVCGVYRGHLQQPGPINALPDEFKVVFRWQPGHHAAPVLILWSSTC